MGRCRDMQGMDHGEMSGMEMGSGETAPKDLIADGEYSDERFIDMMAAGVQELVLSGFARAKER